MIQDVHLECRVISIHAPHARSDTISLSTLLISLISIHAPHARSDDAAD